MNNLKTGLLTSEYLGRKQWGLTLNVPILNIHHEWYKYPVASFKGPYDILFKFGHVYTATDLTQLLELHELWTKEIEQLP